MSPFSNWRRSRRLRTESRAVDGPFARLPHDLILLIFEHVHTASPSSAAALALVHPSFTQQARYVLYRRVNIDAANRHDAAARRLKFIVDNDLLPAIRELHVLNRFNSFESHDLQCLSQLAGLIAAMTGLRSLHWEHSPIPALVLASIRQLPHPVRLHVVCRLDARRNQAAVGQILADLASCGALVSITLDISYTKPQDCLQVCRLLKQLLLTCPALRNLSIDFHHPRLGCVAYGPPNEYPGMGFSGGEHPLRPLESLVIHEYPWGQQRPSGDRFMYLQYSLGYPVEVPEVDYWVNIFDWSALRRLELTWEAGLVGSTQVFVANKLAPKLTALREVRFTATREVWSGESLSTFFNTVPSLLEAISVPHLVSLGVAAFRRHAQTLRRLTIHQSEQSGWADQLLTKDVLEELLETLPQLEELSIDMSRTGDEWPHEKLALLARLPRLRELELWFSFRGRPVLKASSAVELFTSLRHACPTLRQLRVHAGCPPPLGLGFLSDFGHSYIEDNATSFTCRAAERGDEAVAGVVAVTSPKFSPRLNARMQRILRGEAKREDIQDILLALRVALDGPVEYEEWKLWRERWPWLPANRMEEAEGGLSQANGEGHRTWGCLSRLRRR